MDLKQTYLTGNDCFRAGRTITPQGIMVHSTATPGVMADAWFSRWNRSGLDVAVHAFADDKQVCQHLPWNHRAWHCGGSANNTHIAFELCEPSDWKTNRAYLNACYQNGVELAIYLCRRFALCGDDVISHAEGHALGIASNHADPAHWWSRFGVTMDDFRRDVDAALTPKEKAAAAANRPTLSAGATGARVAALQRALCRVRETLGLHYAAPKADGIFGDQTKRAVMAFQKARNLTADGIAGPRTHQALAVGYGDVDANGKVTASDALAALRAAVGKQTLTESARAAADMDADGSVTAADAKQILRRAVDGS